MKAFIVTKNEETQSYLLQVKQGDKITDVAESPDLMELLSYIYEMAEPERVMQELGVGLQ